MLNEPVYVSSIRFPKSKMIFWDSLNSGRYADMSLMYVQMMPLAVGSAVEVLKISVSLKYIRASLSNCRPREVTVKLNVMRLKSHAGGM